MDLDYVNPEIFFNQIKKIVEDNNKLRQDVASFQTRLVYWINRASDLKKELTELKSQPIANNEPVQESQKFKLLGDLIIENGAHTLVKYDGNNKVSSIEVDGVEQFTANNSESEVKAEMSVDNAWYEHTAEIEAPTADDVYLVEYSVPGLHGNINKAEVIIHFHPTHGWRNVITPCFVGNTAKDSLYAVHNMVGFKPIFNQVTPQAASMRVEFENLCVSKNFYSKDYNFKINTTYGKPNLGEYEWTGIERMWQGFIMARQSQKITPNKAEVPEGWKLVPVGPTSKMKLLGETFKIKYGYGAHDEPLYTQLSEREFERLWISLLDEAPLPPLKDGE